MELIVERDYRVAQLEGRSKTGVRRIVRIAMRTLGTPRVTVWICPPSMKGGYQWAGTVREAQAVFGDVRPIVGQAPGADEWGAHGVPRPIEIAAVGNDELWFHTWSPGGKPTSGMEITVNRDEVLEGLEFIGLELPATQE